MTWHATQYYEIEAVIRGVNPWDEDTLVWTGEIQANQTINHTFENLGQYDRIHFRYKQSGRQNAQLHAVTGPGQYTFEIRNIWSR